MNVKLIKERAKNLVAPGKGILAADDNADVVFARFAELGIDRTTNTLNDYWNLLFSVDGLSEFVSGVILSEDAVKMDIDESAGFAALLSEQGIAVGVGLDREDKILESTDGEEIAGGLDNLKERLASYAAYGADFSKWCMTIRITDNLPSDFAIQANALQLARFASLSQSVGIVPIVEFDVLTEGDHSIDRCAEITSRMLSALFPALSAQAVDIEGIVLKPSMVSAGRGHGTGSKEVEIASSTVPLLQKLVPAEVPGIAFLSGGQSPTEVTVNLNTINGFAPNAPWPMTFCFGRALQHPVQQAWLGDPDNRAAMQQAMLHRARMNSLASRAIYSASDDAAVIG